MHKGRRKGELASKEAITAELKRHPEGSRNKELAKHRGAQFMKMLGAKARGQYKPGDMPQVVPGFNNVGKGPFGKLMRKRPGAR